MAHFALSKPDKTGKTRLQVLLDIKKQTGVIAKELSELPELPSETAHVWDWFGALSNRRGAGFALEPIAWNDMDAFFRLRKIRPMGWEADCIAQLDDAFLASRMGKADGAVSSAKGMKNAMGAKRG